MKRNTANKKSSVTTATKPSTSCSKATTKQPVVPKPKVPSGDGWTRDDHKHTLPSPDAEEAMAAREAMYRKQWEESDVPIAAPKPVRMSFQMIARRNLPAGIADGPEDILIDSLSKITHLRLDREMIGDIYDLELMGPVTNLYLQQNCIRKIENLDSLQSLRFLILANNEIQRVENLTVLPELKLLDLSNNQIDALNTDELPMSLLVIDLRGNPCQLQDKYKETVLSRLSNLKQLDGEAISGEEDEAEDCSDDGSSDDEAGSDHDTAKLLIDFIHDSRSRVKAYANEHYEHMSQLVAARGRSRLAMNLARADTATGAT